MPFDGPPEPTPAPTAVPAQCGGEARLRRTLLTLVLLVTAFAFVGALDNQLVNWDDTQNLVSNRAYRGLSPDHVAWMFSTTYGGHFQPLAWITFAIDYLVWDGAPFGFHFTNIVLHLLTTVGFFHVMLRLLRRPNGRGSPIATLAGATAATLLFAVHPLRVESVAWATERRDVLSGAWLMLTLLLYLNAVATSSRRRRRVVIALAVVCYTLSLLSKASGVTLPVVLLLLDLYPLARRNQMPGVERGAAVWRVPWEKVTFAVPAVVVAVAAIAAQSRAGALWTLASHSLGLRFAQAAYGVMFYLAKSIGPFGLIPLYEQPPDDSATRPVYLACVACVMALTFVAWSLRRRYPAVTVTWFSYLVLLAPVSGLAQSGPQLVADRYTYLACMPWAALAGAWVARAWDARSAGSARRRPGIVVCGVLVTLLLTVLTRTQVGVWHDSETLWTTTLERAPRTGVAHANLAAVLNERGDVERGRDQARKAIEILPGNLNAHRQLAWASAVLQDWPTAERHYRIVLEMTRQLGRPDLPTVTALARVIEQQGRFEEAERLYREAMPVEP